MHNWIDQDFLETKNLDLLLKLKRKTKITRTKKNKTIPGNSIEKQPDIVDKREEFGHWDIDTMIGLKSGHDQGLLTLTELKTQFEIIQKIESKTSAAGNAGIENLRTQFAGFFGDVFKTITSDNGV